MSTNIPALPRVLFVDDQAQVLDHLRVHVSEICEPMVAQSAEKGLEIFKQYGPFAIIVSDQALPGMNGADFLAMVNRRDPFCSTMLLTGHADYSDAMQAVNEGHVFRLLEKPYSPQALREAIQAGIRQRQLMESEKVLLQETLVGAVNALTETLATVKPLFFGRAQRVKRLAGEIARYLHFPHIWQVETAAVFSQLASITLPEEEAENVFQRKRLIPQVEKLVRQSPKVIDHLLGNIPRLEEVREILNCLMVSEEPYQTDDKALVLQAYEILRAALDYDYIETEGHDSEISLATLKGAKKTYQPEVVEAMSQLLHKSKTRYLVNELTMSELEVGMRLAQDLKLETEMLVAPKGTDISRHFLQVLHNYESCYDRSPFPKLIKVFVKEEEIKGKN
ncbi:MAG: response regulator [Opitutales bacterium]|nr:response regulator [Opitutales bacterium]